MSIRAGAMACDITPDAEMALAGHQGSPRTSCGSSSPLLVSAIHLRSGSGGTLILSFDVHSLDPAWIRDVRSRICKATGTREQNILIGVTQTLSAPVTAATLADSRDMSRAMPTQGYLEFLAERAVHAASESAVASVPASIAILPLGVPGTGAIVIVDTRASRVLGLVLVTNDVPDHLGPDNTLLSSDSLASLRNRLAARFGQSLVVAMLPAPAADHLIDVEPRKRGTEAAETDGNTLADAILEAYDAMPRESLLSSVSFAGKLTDTPPLPCRSLPTEFEAAVAESEAVKLFANIQQSQADRDSRMAARWGIVDAISRANLVAAAKNGLLTPVLDQYKPAQVQIMQIGPLRLLCLPTAVLPDCGTKLAAAAGPNTWIVECVNGDMFGSILGSDDSDEGGYVLLSPVFQPDAGAIIAKSILDLVADEP